MVNMRDKRDYGYVGTGEANYGKVDKFNEMVSDEVKKLFLSLSEFEKAAVCGLSGPSGGFDRGGRDQGEGDGHDTEDGGSDAWSADWYARYGDGGNAS